MDGNGLRSLLPKTQFRRRTKNSFPIIGRQGALCGNIHVVDGEFYATEHAVVVDCGLYGDPVFKYGLLTSTHELIQYATATAQPGLSVKKIEELPFQLPPLAEQKRIASRVTELFTEIDRAEKAYEELQSLANVLRGQILQKAIQGKLVPQLPEDGVVDQIGEAPAEVPFEIPESWKWLKIKEICILQSGKFIKASEISVSGLYPCYGANGVRGCVDKYNYDGDYILIGRVGACGNIHIANGKFYVTDNAIVAGFKKDLIDQKFLALSLTAMNLKKLASATAQPLITSTKIENLILSLPPLAEQKRIVSKVDTLFEQIDLMTK